MESSTFFEAKFQKHIDQLEKRLGNYIDDPQNDKNVHDVRTTLRRIDSMFALLNKKNRRANKKRMARYREFFKANSRVRDHDIMIARLSSLSPESRPLVLALKKKRNSEFDSVVVKAKMVRRAGRIKTKKMTNEEFIGRTDKVVAKLCTKIKENLALTLADSANVSQLHSLRKDLKKLRYVFESLDEHVLKSYEKKVADAAGIALDVALIQKLQDMLGEIHDSDITLEYLKASGAGVAAELQKKEQAGRQTLYLDFSRYMRSIDSGRAKSM